MNATCTDAVLLEAAIAKAGSPRALADALLVSRVTLWRWRREGRIVKVRDRVSLERYMEGK